MLKKILFLFIFSPVHAQQNLKTMVSSIIPLRADGKINIPPHVKHVKLDIGLSSSAPMSQQWLTHEDDLLVFGFEPNPNAVRRVLSGKEFNKDFIGKSFFLIPCALGLSKDIMIKFFVTSGDEGCSSIYTPKHSIHHVAKIIDVPIFSLAKFFDLFPFDSHPVIDYIKIDAQGADLDIAKSAGNYLKEKVIYITLEAENAQYANTENSEQEIERYMQSIGFIRQESVNTSDPTYFNTRYSSYIKTHTIKIYQKG